MFWGEQPPLIPVWCGGGNFLIKKSAVQEGSRLHRDCIWFVVPQPTEGQRLMFLRVPGVNRQGQAHIVSTAIVSPGSGKGGREVEATPCFRTWSFIDPPPPR